jgi:starch-binding outer membrane protein, SusD/RagB family
MIRYLGVPATRRGLGTFAAAALLAACSPDEILRVTDPDVINPEDITSLAGAEALRIGALRQFNEATSGDESMFLYGGLLADEWRSGDTFAQRDETDKRSVQRSNANIDDAWRDIHHARVAAQLAQRGYERFAPAETFKIGEMLMVQAYAEILLAEHFCSGIPLSTIEDGAVVFAAGSSMSEVFESALAHATEALDFLGGDDGRVEFGAKVLQARALVGLGRFADAAAAVADVPDDFAYVNQHSATTEENVIWQLNNSDERYTVANLDGGNGLPFVTAGDPRVPVEDTGDDAFDSVTPLFTQQIWPENAASVAVISGIEARLIEAEAALKAGNYATPATGTLAILNDLRVSQGMLPLAAAATPEEQVRQLFDERGYWLFSTGHRLGDLRRLIRPVAEGGYGLLEDDVFPTGEFFKGGEYGDDVNFPIPQSEDNNPLFTTSANPGGCENRNP